jgi:hypothetical protein
VSATVVLDLAGLAALDAFPARAARVVVLFQASPRRLESLELRFPGATIVRAAPNGEGPWQADVEADLAALDALEVTVDGVPLLDSFRASWREGLAFVRALRWGLAGTRSTVAAAGGPAAAVLEVVRGRGGLEEAGVVEGPPSARHGLLARVRRVGRRGLAFAVMSRLDPTHARRARLRLAPRLSAAPSLVVASYVNASRAAFEALAASGGGAATFVRSGLGALDGLSPPPGVRAIPLAAALALDRARGAALRRDVLPQALGRVARWGGDDPWAAGPLLSATSFGRALARVLLPEILATVAGIPAVVRATGARRVFVGDEFSYIDRATIRLARSLGLETVSRQHGVLDSHYLRDRLLADRHLAWDEPTVAWLRSRGAVGERRVEALPRRLPPPRARARAPSTVAVFLQPLELLPAPLADWTEETLPAVVAAARARGLRVVLKPHPLQTAILVGDAVPASVRDDVRVAEGVPARDLLADAAAAVTLDSSVCVDCRDAGVPCFSTAWYPGTYASELARLGWVRPCATPADLEAAVRAAGSLP